MSNWNQYRQTTGGHSSGKYYEQTQLKVIDLGSQHPSKNWWNDFFNTAEIETMIVVDGEAISAKGLFIVDEVESWPYFNDERQMWMVSVISSSAGHSDSKFQFKGICDLGFKDYAEAGQVKKGSLFYKESIVNG